MHVHRLSSPDKVFREHPGAMSHTPLTGRDTIKVTLFTQGVPCKDVVVQLFAAYPALCVATDDSLNNAKCNVCSARSLYITKTYTQTYTVTGIDTCRQTDSDTGRHAGTSKHRQEQKYICISKSIQSTSSKNIYTNINDKHTGIQRA